MVESAVLGSTTCRKSLRTLQRKREQQVVAMSSFSSTAMPYSYTTSHTVIEALNVVDLGLMKKIFLRPWNLRGLTVSFTFLICSLFCFSAFWCASPLFDLMVQSLAFVHNSLQPVKLPEARMRLPLQLLNSYMYKNPKKKEQKKKRKKTAWRIEEQRRQVTNPPFSEIGNNLYLIKPIYVLFPGQPWEIVER